MKKNLIGLIGMFVFAVFIVSCESEVIESTDSAEDNAAIETVIEDTEQEAELQLEDAMKNSSSQGNCPTFTWAVPKGTYPNTLTIDFGTACLGQDGKTRSGIISIYMSDSIKIQNAYREISLTNFEVDSVSVEGTTRFTNNGNASFTKQVTNAKITLPNGNVIRDWNATRTTTQTAGVGTFTVLDNEFSTTGTSNGINRNGKNFSDVITTPLVTTRICRWVKSGVVDHTVNGKTFTLDYGNGTCDRKATVTGPNGNSKTIILRK